MFKFIKLHYPPDAPTGSGNNLPSGELSKQAIEDYLNDDKEEPEVIPLEDKEDKKSKKDEKDEKEVKGDKDDKEDKGENEEIDEDDELKDIEEELDEPDDEKLELVTPVRRKEILAKYPNVFKDFPFLEKAYYREQKFTELLPTIDDAKAAVEARDTLDSFEKDLNDGNIGGMLQAAKNASPEAFNKIADNYLQTLFDVDQKAFHHVVGNTIKHTIIAMVKESRASGNEALQDAAALLNQFLFGKTTFENPTKLSSDEKKDPDKNKLDDERKQFKQERLDTSVSEVNTRVNNAYKATIENNIDPKKSMSDYVRKTASREALEDLEKAINSDTRFKVLVDRLWDKAIKESFSKDSVDTIRRAFLSKAKTLLPSVIKKARHEALKGMGKRVSEDKEDTDDKSSKHDNADKSQSRSSKSDTKVPRGMSSLDYLMQD